MKETDGIIRTQVDALMTLLEQSRSAHCSEVHETAALEAAEMRRRARKLARGRVSKAANEERQRLEHEVRMVEAEIETEHRRRARKRDMALIEAGRKALAEALAARWGERAQRRAWAEALLAEAAEVLLRREWTLEHPAGWAAEEREHAIGFARAHCGATLTAVPAEDLETGLRIRSEGALVDMSIPGLLANERTIEGELLAEFNRAAEGETS
jgi:hypothetical protein